MTSKSPSSSLSWLRPLLVALYFVSLAQLLVQILTKAYTIRMHAINEYGRVIHEFDPYFNYRATEYLWEHGWQKFVTWFDYMSWYPLGRPVGTTIYPGMQVSAVLIKQYLMPTWSINDICCFIPAWYGAIATFFTAAIAYECTAGTQPFGSILNDIPIVRNLYQWLVLPLAQAIVAALMKATGSSWGLVPHKTRHPAAECALFAAAIMSIVPAHIMRSVGGGYDNESVATTAMTFTFFAWTRSLRGTEPNYLWSIIAGLGYFYMVAAWGGYVFVLNLIGVHATILVLLGRYSTKVHRAYTIFYLVGTVLAIQVPVVGWTPLKSLEQMGPLLAFVCFQLIEVCEIIKRRCKLRTMDTWKLRVLVFAGVTAIGAAIVFALAPTGYFGPISSRVRGLFVQHTKTGNPLVDSVAEHQPASSQAYFQYLHDVCFLAPVGFALVVFLYMNDSSSFLLVYGVTAYFFSHRMVRLILLTAPIASVLGGMALGHAWAWCLGCITREPPSASDLFQDEENDKPENAGNENDDGKEKSLNGDPVIVRIIRLGASAYLIFSLQPYFSDFYDISHRMAKEMSHPTIIQKAVRRTDNQEVVIDDYRDAYFWLRDNTPEDARIMAWWDYGYQITGIANRTTIADGNTWNHEHIALLGRTLTSPEKDAHRIARHLADYILTWTGGGGDDLAKSPHLARIANSVYRNICPADPTCRRFGFLPDGRPTPMMEASLLYKLNRHELDPDVQVDKNRFRLVYQTKYGKVRVYKILSVSTESKAWAADPANRICDAEGSWFCRGQYPPVLQKILQEKKDFKQLEDFNLKGEDDSEYQRQYMENLKKGHSGQYEPESEPPKQKQTIRRIPKEEIDDLNDRWENNEMTTAVWELISKGNTRELRDLLISIPEAAHMRSQDGRGPMWWAHEYGRTQIIKLLKKVGVSETLKDVHGVTPLDLMES